MRVMEPMLFVMVTSVALAKSSFETDSRFSLHIMLPKLTTYKQKNIYILNINMHILHDYHLHISMTVTEEKCHISPMRYISLKNYQITIWCYSFVLVISCVLYTPRSNSPSWQAKSLIVTPINIFDQFIHTSAFTP